MPMQYMLGRRAHSCLSISTQLAPWGVMLCGTSRRHRYLVGPRNAVKDHGQAQCSPETQHQQRGTWAGPPESRLQGLIPLRDGPSAEDQDRVVPPPRNSSKKVSLVTPLGPTPAFCVKDIPTPLPAQLFPLEEPEAAPLDEDLEGDADREALFADANGLQEPRVPQLAADDVCLEEPRLLSQREGR